MLTLRLECDGFNEHGHCCSNVKRKDAVELSHMDEIPVKYSFLEPVSLHIVRPDGEAENIFFGIGECITVLEPRWTTLEYRHETHVDLKLSDGGRVIDFPTFVKHTKKAG